MPLADNVEYSYSFAIEYTGSPLSLDIPRVLPIDAATVSKKSTRNESQSSYESSNTSTHIRKRNASTGSCYRCHKGNRFTPKESCLVCDAKYCRDCVVRVMGSMPEGRKCVTCIGFPIDKTKLGLVGKNPRVLNKVLVGLEIKQILKSEIAVNGIPAHLISVNGRPLCQEEKMLLQNCPKPPKKLKPGNYWYDKDCGLWGKEKRGPWQIITPQLNVGDLIKQNASNGKTNVLINGREITQRELCILWLGGIRCRGKTSFWVTPDGSCVEEGHNKEKGMIWTKKVTKICCVALSLPILGMHNIPCADVTNYQKKSHKFLLVGSGSSTIYKQAKILYNVPFTEDEHEHIKCNIRSNIYAYIGVLFEWQQRFENECLIAERRRVSTDQSNLPEDSLNDQNGGKTMYSIDAKTRTFSDWLLKVIASGNLESITPIYAPRVEESWKDAGIQATYNRINESELPLLPRTASYFLNKAIEVSKSEYEPSDMDILHAHGDNLWNAPSCMEYSYPESQKYESIGHLYRHESSSRYQLTRVHPENLGGEKCKWLEMFADTELLLFCVDLNDYNKFTEDGNIRLSLMKSLFESIVAHPIFCDKNILLILNISDLFEELVDRVPLARCDWLNDFNPPKSSIPGNNSSMAQHGAHYIANKFKRLFYEFCRRKLYVSIVYGLEAHTVDEALRYGREILRWEEEKQSFIANDASLCTIDLSDSI